MGFVMHRMVLFFLSFVRISFSERDGLFNSLDGMRVAGVYKQIDITRHNKIFCTQLCVADSQCISANFNNRKLSCELSMYHPSNIASCVSKADDWTLIYKANGSKAISDWFNWTPWSICSKSCGRGIRTRTHQSSCSPTMAHSQDCNTFSCDHYEQSYRDWVHRHGLVESSIRSIAPVDNSGNQLSAVTVYCDLDSSYGDVVTVIGGSSEESIYYIGEIECI